MEIIMHQTDCGEYVFMSHHPQHHVSHDVYIHHPQHERKPIVTSRSEGASLIPSSPPSPLGVIDLTNEDDDDDEEDDYDDDEEDDDDDSEDEEAEASMRRMSLQPQRMTIQKKRVSFCPVVTERERDWSAGNNSSASSLSRIMTEEERSAVWYRRSDLDGFKSLARTISRRMRQQKTPSSSSATTTTTTSTSPNSSSPPTTALCWSHDALSSSSLSSCGGGGNEQLAESLLQHPTIMTADEDEDDDDDALFHPASPPPSPSPSPPQEEQVEEGNDFCARGLEQRISVERQRIKYMCSKWILRYQRHLKNKHHPEKPPTSQQQQQQPLNLDDMYFQNNSWAQEQERFAAEQLAQFAIRQTVWATKIAIDTAHLDFLDAYNAPPPPSPYQNVQTNTHPPHDNDNETNIIWDDCPRMPAIKRKGFSMTTTTTNNLSTTTMTTSSTRVASSSLERTRTLDHVWDYEDGGGDHEPIHHHHHAIRNVRRRTYPIHETRNEDDVILCAFPEIMRLATPPPRINMSPW